MAETLERIAAGDVRAVARAATLLENGDAGAAELLAAITVRAGRARVFGVTGPPGAGKSTLIDALVRVLRSRQLTVGVLAVDPSSPVTGGAILGDRVRMQDHHSDSGVFVRSLASRGARGGLAAAARALTLLLDAAGRDVILVETVGTGQEETSICRLADATMLVLFPGAGDDVQAMKAGVMEMADVYVINKADHSGASDLERDLRGALELAHRSAPVLRTIATSNTGIVSLADAILAFPGKPDRRRSPAGGVGIDGLRLTVDSVERATAALSAALGVSFEHRVSFGRRSARASQQNWDMELTEPPPSGAAVHFLVADLAAARARIRSAGLPSREVDGSIMIEPSAAGGLGIAFSQEQGDPD